jgi:hypothetical protein
MWQQLSDLTRPLRRQTRENVFQVSIWVMPVELRRLDQAPQRRRAFAAAQQSCEEPILASKSPWPDLLLDVVVINRHRAVIQIT